jgi:hypothetical protein
MTMITNTKIAFLIYLLVISGFASDKKEDKLEKTDVSMEIQNNALEEIKSKIEHNEKGLVTIYEYMAECDKDIKDAMYKKAYYDVLIKKAEEAIELKKTKLKELEQIKSDLEILDESISDAKKTDYDLLIKKAVDAKSEWEVLLKNMKKELTHNIEIQAAIKEKLFDQDKLEERVNEEFSRLIKESDIDSSIDSSIDRVNESFSDDDESFIDLYENFINKIRDSDIDKIRDKIIDRVIQKQENYATKTDKEMQEKYGYYQLNEDLNKSRRFRRKRFRRKRLRFRRKRFRRKTETGAQNKENYRKI